MHNNDLSKDDFLEAFLAILDRIKEWFFEKKKNNENKDLIAENQDEQIKKFKEIIQFIREKDLGEDVNKMLDYMEQYPEESLKLISGAIKDQLTNKVENIQNNNEKLNDTKIENINLISNELIAELKELRETISEKVDMLINKYEPKEIKQGKELNNNHMEKLEKVEQRMEIENQKKKEEVLVREEVIFER